MSDSISVGDQYRTYLDRLLTLVYDSLVLKAATWRAFSDRLQAEEVPKRAPFATLVLCHEALETDIVLSLSRLLEGDRSDRNILRFLNFVESNRGRIQWRKPFTASQLMAHKTSLEGHRPVIDAILSQRDKYFAHADKEFFLDPGARHVRFPFDFSDVVAIVRTLQNILGDHSEALTGHVRVSMDGFAALAAAQLWDLASDASAPKTDGAEPR